MASPRRYLTYLNYLTGRARSLFIHVPKNAGVAVKRSPSLQWKVVPTEPWFYADPNYVQRLRETMAAEGEHHGLHHARLRDIHPNVRSRLRPFAVIRNPWSRVVSRYRFAQLVMQNNNVGGDYAPASFEAFLDERFLYGEKEFYWHRAIRGWYQQLDYVVDENGVIGADLLRQEHLSAEVQRYFQTADALGHRNVSGKNSKPYREFYTPKTIQIVADWYRDDIEMFGFDFDSAAKRNCFFETPPAKQAA